MRDTLRKPLRALGGVFFVLSPFLTHFILIGHADRLGAASAALILCQGLCISGLIAARVGQPFRIPAIAVVMTVSLVLALFHLHGGLVLTAGAPHAVSYLGLLAIFGQSLLPGREPIVTYFARAIHGGLAPEIENYTRRVTWAWCGFFALQIAGSALLLMHAPLAWW